MSNHERGEESLGNMFVVRKASNLPCPYVKNVKFFAPIMDVKFVKKFRAIATLTQHAAHAHRVFMSRNLHASNTHRTRTHDTRKTRTQALQERKQRASNTHTQHAHAHKTLQAPNETLTKHVHAHASKSFTRTQDVHERNHTSSGTQPPNQVPAF